MRRITSRSSRSFRSVRSSTNARPWIGLAGNRDFERVVMSVPMRIIALAEDAPVLLGRKSRIVVEMRGRKFDLARDRNHYLAAMLAGYSRPFHVTVPRAYLRADANRAAQ